MFLFVFLNKSIALCAAGNDYVITLLQTGFFQHSHSAEIIGRHCIGMGFVGTLVNKSHVFLQVENNWLGLVTEQFAAAPWSKAQV